MRLFITFINTKLLQLLTSVWKIERDISWNKLWVFAYTLHNLLKQLGFTYQKADNRKVLMQIPRIVVWRWEYLREIVDTNPKFIWLSTWMRHGLIPMIQPECFLLTTQKNAPLQHQIQKVDELFMPCWKDLRLCPKFSLLYLKQFFASYADYYDDMNANVFKNYFENTLLKNLPQDRKVLIVMDKVW